MNHIEHIGDLPTRLGVQMVRYGGQTGRVAGRLALLKANPYKADFMKFEKYPVTVDEDGFKFAKNDIVMPWYERFVSFFQMVKTNLYHREKLKGWRICLTKI